MAILGDVVAEWRKFAENRKTIVFGATIAHCEEMARSFNDAGIMAACFTSDTRETERAALLCRVSQAGFRAARAVECQCSRKRI